MKISQLFLHSKADLKWFKGPNIIPEILKVPVEIAEDRGSIFFTRT